MEQTFIFLFLFLIFGMLSFQFLKTFVKPPVAFLISIGIAVLLGFVTIQGKEGMGHDTTFQNLTVNNSQLGIGSNNYLDEGGLYYDSYLRRSLANSENRAFVGVKNLNVVSGRMYGNVAGQNETGTVVSGPLNL
jgi:hypothetical protein